MILATWNVNSITVRISQVIAWLAEHQPDVLCIQESKVEDSKFPIDRFREIGYDAQFHGQKSYNGVAIISKHKIDQVEKRFRDTEEPDQARFIRGTVGDTVILNAYVPNGGSVGSDKYAYKLEWLMALRRYLDENLAPTSKVLLCGDFNVAPEDRDVYNPERVRGQILVSDQERETLEVVRNWGLIDSFRIHEQEPGHHTWWDYRLLGFKRKMGFRIDHIYVSEALAKNCKRVWIDIEPRRAEKPSDHTPVLGEFV
jgi:exodeoxyribonuclease-3